MLALAYPALKNPAPKTPARHASCDSIIRVDFKNVRLPNISQSDPLGTATSSKHFLKSKKFGSRTFF
jgi:hypothetical protein